MPDERKLSFDEVKAMADDWGQYMDLPAELVVKVVVQDVSEFSRAAGYEDDGRAFTMGNEDNTEFTIAFDPRALEREDIEQIVVHELVHVWSFSQVGDDPRANMEAIADQLAQFIRERRATEERVKARTYTGPLTSLTLCEECAAVNHPRNCLNAECENYIGVPSR